MNGAIRIGNAKYPLTISGESLSWSASQNGFHTSIKLPTLDPGQIIVPSFSGQQLFQFNLSQGDKSYALHPVPSSQKAELIDPSDKTVSCHIDCWHSHKQLNRAKIDLFVASLPSDEYLLTLTHRALKLDNITLPTESVVMAPPPQRLSQNQAAEPNIRRRICSPTALTMALSYHCPDLNWPTVIEACLDPQTNAYGAWPRAIRTANAYGCVSAVECFASWQQVIPILQQGLAVVCSVRWSKDQPLDNAPMNSSGGHLVLLYGVDQSYAYVADPAAETHEQVLRKYDIGQFTQAWLSYRGAGYVINGTDEVALKNT